VFSTLSLKRRKTMSVENPSFENKPEPNQEQTSEKPKTDWSFLDDIYKKQKEEARAKMTPEEVAEDDRKTKEAEDLLKWAEMSNKRKSGNPQERAEAEVYFGNQKKEQEKKRKEEDEKYLASRTPEQIAQDEWFKMDKKRKSGTPTERAEAKEWFDAKRKKESLENDDEGKAKAMLESAKDMTFMELSSLTGQIAEIKDVKIMQETFAVIKGLMEKRMKEELRAKAEKNKSEAAEREKKMVEESQKRREDLAKFIGKSNQDLAKKEAEINERLRKDLERIAKERDEAIARLRRKE
jgi:hypothetical protein